MVNIFYPKIETLFVRDLESHKILTDTFKSPVYSIISSWLITEKIDGMNIRIMWDGTKLLFGGRTDKASIPAELVNYLNASCDIEKFKLVFPDTIAILYGEGYGAGIQKNGGAYSKTKSFVAFDILIDGKWWMDWKNTVDICDKLGLLTVPFMGSKTLHDAMQIVREGFDSLLALTMTGEKRPAEGIVGRTIEPLFDRRGRRIILKLKTHDFGKEKFGKEKNDSLEEKAIASILKRANKLE